MNASNVKVIARCLGRQESYIYLFIYLFIFLLLQVSINQRTPKLELGRIQIKKLLTV